MQSQPSNPDPRTIDRIADRVANICERVVYEVSGKMEEINVSKY